MPRGTFGDRSRVLTFPIRAFAGPGALEVVVPAMGSDADGRITLHDLAQAALLSAPAFPLTARAFPCSLHCDLHANALFICAAYQDLALVAAFRGGPRHREDALRQAGPAPRQDQLPRGYGQRSHRPPCSPAFPPPHI